ncbi:MAG: N-acetylmuramoyl-L-alanine amidase [Clostridia bacterium]|nr:N-acetylmuramoyl-L-alanine amidase [Clostridia bacterium]
MPTIYLSPSTQEFNPYSGGGNEEEYMNLIADAMVPYLNASGINYVRNTPDMTAASSIKASNSGSYDFHFAIHSNASGAGNGNVQGAEFYYAPNSYNGQRAAQIFANNFKEIYPLPERVRTVPTTTLGEVVRTKAPAVLAEVAYHDNAEDAEWIRNNVDRIAENLVLSLTDYFDIPFNKPNENQRNAVVTTMGGNLNVRQQPTITSHKIGSVPNGATVTVYYDTGEWSLIKYGNITGYVNNNYLR